MSAITTAGRRLGGAIRSTIPEGAPGYAFLGLIGLGVALRLVAVVSWWPVSTTLGDSYELYVTKPFENPLHPAGYALPLILVATFAVIICLPRHRGCAEPTRGPASHS